MENMDDRLAKLKQEAFDKAVNALAGYKFLMFGYWAAEWVKLNKLSERNDPNPFSDMVKWARGIWTS